MSDENDEHKDQGDVSDQVGVSATWHSTLLSSVSASIHENPSGFVQIGLYTRLK